MRKPKNPAFTSRKWLWTMEDLYDGTNVKRITGKCPSWCPSWTTYLFSNSNLNVQTQGRKRKFSYCLKCWHWASYTTGGHSFWQKQPQNFYGQCVLTSTTKKTFRLSWTFKFGHTAFNLRTQAPYTWQTVRTAKCTTTLLGCGADCHSTSDPQLFG